MFTQGFPASDTVVRSRKGYLRQRRNCLDAGVRNNVAMREDCGRAIIIIIIIMAETAVV